MYTYLDIEIARSELLATKLEELDFVDVAALEDLGDLRHDGRFLVKRNLAKPDARLYLYTLYWATYYNRAS